MKFGLRCAIALLLITATFFNVVACPMNLKASCCKHACCCKTPQLQSSSHDAVVSSAPSAPI